MRIRSFGPKGSYAAKSLYKIRWTNVCLTALLAACTIASASAQDVTTYHNDNARTGQNLGETILTPSNVNTSTFGKLWVLAADGKVDAEPLYLSAVTLPDTTVHNIVYVASEHDTVYAYDADTGALLWHVSMLKSGETTSDDRGCSQVTPEIGITATPAIDRSIGPHGTLYVVAMSKDSSGNYHQRLHALDITTGAEEFGGPVDVAATYPGTGDNSSGGNVIFDPKQYKERPGLLILNGQVYTSWSSHCDIRPYTAWIISYAEGTLAQTSVLDITPNGSEGSVWQSGAGIAADASGNIYFLTANGTFDTTLNAQGFPTLGDYGNAFMKLSTTSNILAVADYFNMSNTVSESNADADLGSGGALVLPDMIDSGGTTRHLAVGAGKDRNIYLVDRDNMGKFNPNTNNIYQQLNTPLAGTEYGMAAYFNGAIYYGSVGDKLKMFPFASAKLASSPSSETAITFTYPGTTPSISANGAANGVVWATENTNPAVLHAYDASNLATELYNSNQAASGRDQFGAGNKFITPMIIHGKVYVGTTTGVGVFGLLASVGAVQLSPGSLTFGSQLVGTSSASQPVTLTNPGAATLTISSIAASGDFSQINNCGSSQAGGAHCTLNVTFKPAGTGTRNGTLTVTDNASNSPQSTSLTGTGIAPAVSLSTSSLTFAGQLVGTTSSSKPVTLTNTGTATLSVQNIATSGDFTQTNNCGSSVNMGSQCTINVTFKPAAGGARNGSLTITDNASGSPQSVTLSGTGTDFSVSAAPTSRTLSGAGASTTFTLTVAPLGGLTGTVSLSCSGTPTHATCAFSPASVTISGSSAASTATLRTGVGGRTPRGTYKLTLTATFGTLSHSTTVSVKVK